MTVLYDYKDDGTDPRRSEMNFGLVRADNSPKPGFLAAATARQALSNAFAVERLTPVRAISV